MNSRKLFKNLYQDHVATSLMHYYFALREYAADFEQNQLELTDDVLNTIAGRVVSRYPVQAQSQVNRVTQQVVKAYMQFLESRDKHLNYELMNDINTINIVWAFAISPSTQFITDMEASMTKEQPR